MIGMVDKEKGILSCKFGAMVGRNRKLILVGELLCCCNKVEGQRTCKLANKNINL